MFFQTTSHECSTPSKILLFLSSQTHHNIRKNKSTKELSFFTKRRDQHDLLNRGLNHYYRQKKPQRNPKKTPNQWHKLTALEQIIKDTPTLAPMHKMQHRSPKFEEHLRIQFEVFEAKFVKERQGRWCRDVWASLFFPIIIVLESVSLFSYSISSC